MYVFHANNKDNVSCIFETLNSRKNQPLTMMMVLIPFLYFPMLSKAHLESSRRSVMELFRKIRQRLKVFNYFLKKALLQIFNWVLNTLLAFQYSPGITILSLHKKKMFIKDLFTFTKEVLNGKRHSLYSQMTHSEVKGSESDMKWMNLNK